MTDPILRYYEQELAVVKRSLGRYSKDYPSEAEDLNIHQGQIEDPSLARLLDGVAYLNANTQKQLNDQLPEVLAGLLKVLYPSYLQTIPSVAYLALNTKDAPAERINIPKQSRFNGSIESNDCQFQTVCDFSIEPYSLSDTQALSAPFGFNRPKNTEHSNGIIQLTLKTGDPDVHFSHLSTEAFHFYVQGFENNADSLVELLLSNTQCITISDPEYTHHIPLKKDQLKNRISDPSFTYLPHHGNEFLGFDLLTEFFSFKEKKQFFYIDNFDKALQKCHSDEIKINLFMGSIPSEFIRLFDHNVFRLNVVPAINLFEQIGEPISYDERTLSMPVNADSHSDHPCEIIDILSVFEVTPNGEKPLTPLFKQKYASQRADTWQSKKSSDGQHHLVISKSQQSEHIEFNQLFGTRLLCSNGKQACQLDSTLECLEPIDLPSDLAPIYLPSAPIPHEIEHNLHWQFIGLLNANLSSIMQADDKTQHLKQMLALCIRPQINAPEVKAIKDVQFRSQVASFRTLNTNVFATGTEVIITLDTHHSFHAFAEVLNTFFQQFCSFDRFIQLKIKQYGRDGFIKTFPKIHGSTLCL
ncbi:type VI secretion system baseplate subunit TssF [Vibrio sp.]|nr:type VI secretion system baseplate subunit TssF [Vibrio sp.]